MLDSKHTEGDDFDIAEENNTPLKSRTEQQRLLSENSTAARVNEMSNGTQTPRKMSNNASDVDVSYVLSEGGTKRAKYADLVSSIKLHMVLQI